MQVSSRKWGGVDTEECGDVNSTCNSFELYEMHVNQPYRTEADIFMLGGATTDEISVATERGSVQFDENGEMKISDQAYWQIKKIGAVDYSRMKGFNHKVLFHSINIVLPTTKQTIYVLKLVVTKDKATNFSLLRTEPFLSLRMNVSIFNFIGYNASIEGTGLIGINYEPDVFTRDNHLNLVNYSFTNISSIMTAKELKEIIGEKDDEQPLGVASILNVKSGSAKILPIYIYDCQFDQCKCSVEIPARERRQIGVGGAIAFCGKTLLLTLGLQKLINCSRNVTFAQPKLQYSINRIMNRYEKESNLFNDNHQLFLPQYQKSNTNNHLNQKYKRKIVSNVTKKVNYQIEVAGGAYVSLVGGGRGEERFIAKKSLSEYMRKQGEKAEDILHIVDDMSRPWVTFDNCIISW
ncbi:MAG: hypothetical protein EZS28_033052 [Streblomastix strix]|uniref:Uncharacterized protein n=1 Tax=Streblomastix strix TaxID=222440 RepID=A0A5J4UN48_9EUKA|nr:MAG: hypothetical protein EZS28_033052 [Streblomastix strix]